MKSNKLKMESLGGLVLFTAFALCVLLVLLTGAQAYRAVTDRDRAAYDERTAVQYLMTRVRQGDAAGAVTVEDFAGCSALVTTETVENVVYETKVYVYDGYLYELYSEQNSGLAPEDGEAIMELESLTLRQSDGVLTAAVGSCSFTLSLRSGKEVG